MYAVAGRLEPASYHALARAGEGDAGAVGVVVGFEEDDLVAGVEKRLERGTEGPGGAGVDGDLGVRVVLEALARRVHRPAR